MAENVLCKIAYFAGLFWDFIDKRDIDKHAVAVVILCGTVKLSMWCLQFAASSPKSGTDIAAIIAAIWVPWSTVQMAVVSWYFKART